MEVPGAVRQDVGVIAGTGDSAGTADAAGGADAKGGPRRWIRRYAPTSAGGVEQVLALAYGGARVATVLQMIPSLPQGVRTSPEPHLYVATWLVAAVVASGVAVTAALRRPAWPAVGIAADMGLAIAFLVCGAFTVPVDERVGSWVGWAPGYALSVVLSHAGLRRAAWYASVGSITAAYLFFVADAATAVNRSTLIGNALSLLVLGAVARIVVRYIRQVAADADAARAQVAELARREEEHRAQLTMHNATTIMQLLSDPTVPAATRVQLCEQAVVEVRRMRAYLRGTSPVRPAARADSADRTGDVPLCEVLRSAMAGFEDLGLEPALDLADGVAVPEEAGEAVRGAVAGVLHNVRRHAHATMVVVHADAEPDGGRWIVTIRDDGVGFDTEATALGTGLRQQVLAELERHALTARIESTPGLGTQVTIEGKLER